MGCSTPLTWTVAPIRTAGPTFETRSPATDSTAGSSENIRWTALSVALASTAGSPR